MSKPRKRRGSRNPHHLWKPMIWMPILTLGLCLLGAKMILWGKLPEKAITWLPAAIPCTVSLCGAFAGAKEAPRNRFFWGMLFALSYGCILALGNILFFGEHFSDIGNRFLWITAGGVAGSLLANMKKSKIA